jgi:nitroreductase/NAD-dependent dihydropyrimidine dehydrogenase PreA subunit
VNNPVVIHVEKCIGCGLCIDVCPASQLVLQDDKAIVSGTKCIACGHCGAICPNEAVVVPDLDNVEEYATLQISTKWLPYGQYDVASLVSLIRSRRSCRRFLDTPLDLVILKDLTQIGVAAPSGTNSQAWTFTIFPDRSAVLQLLEEVRHFFQRLNKLARMPLLRVISRLGNGELDKYYRQHWESVEKALAEWKESGKDQLFFNAPAVILVGCKPGASTPAEDALLATQNILLAAHSMGLGTCLIGFAVAALKRDPKIQKRIGVPKDEVIHAVIAIGRTDRTFCRITKRKKAITRIVTVGNQESCENQNRREAP